MISVHANLSILISLLLSLVLADSVDSATESFIYNGCSRMNYTPGTPYASNINSLYSSFVNSSTSSSFNEFKASVPGSSPSDVVYGLYQCRGDLSGSDCRECVTQAVGQLGTLCVNSLSAALQLDGCYIKYDNVSFFGPEDKSVIMKRCGAPVGVSSEDLTRRDALLDYLVGSGTQYFRVGNSANFHVVAQCVQDLSTGECQDCLSDAVGRLKSECGLSASGDVFLATCYARFTDSGSYTKNNNGTDNKIERILTITVVLIFAIAMIVILFSYISRALNKNGEK